MTDAVTDPAPPADPPQAGAIRTARLEGRAIRDDDLGAMRALFRDPEVGFGTSPEGASWPASRIAERTASFAAHWRAHGFGLRLWFEDGRLAGLAGLHLRLVDGRGAAEASFAFAPGSHGRGLAAEAMTAALAEADGAWREVLAVSYADNPRSGRLLERLGFEAIGAPQDLPDGLPDPRTRPRILWRRGPGGAGA